MPWCVDLDTPGGPCRSQGWQVGDDSSQQRKGLLGRQQWGLLQGGKYLSSSAELTSPSHNHTGVFLKSFPLSCFPKKDALLA